MKMSSTLKCMRVFTLPHTLLQHLSHNKTRLVQRLQQRPENSKQLLWKEKKNINRIEPLTSELSCQTSHPMHSKCSHAERRSRDWDSHPRCTTQHRETFILTLTPGALKKAGKKKAILFACSLTAPHSNCIHRFNSMTGIKQQIAVVLGAFIQQVIKFFHCHSCLPQTLTSGDSHAGKLHPPPRLPTG